MPAPGSDPFEYALIRVVPRVERGECVNVGVVLFCRSRNFLEARIELDPKRLAALAPDLDLEAVRQHLDLIPLVCAGDPAAGAIARLPQAERFGWLVAPGSTVVQPSEVHTGLSTDPAEALDHLLATMVRLPAEKPETPDDGAPGVGRRAPDVSG
jgi:hypothetical protein